MRPGSDSRDVLQLPVLACGALVTLSLALAAWSSWTRGGEASDSANPVEFTAAAARDIRFEDRSGTVAVIDARSGGLIEQLPVGADAFVRATMRSLARDRRLTGLGAEVPFRLARQHDGHLVLIDPATGRSVALAAFGATNERAFARFLDAAQTAPDR
jgi:putative photosynthetic complex assembly protein